MAEKKVIPPEENAPLAAAEAALDRLAARLAPPSIGAQIRRLLPKIESAIENGASHQQILETLCESGIEMSMATFRSALYRARNKAGQDSRKKESGAGGGSSGGEGTSGPPTTASSAMSPEGPQRTRDPLAVPEKPRSFDWDPTERPNITFVNEDDDSSSS